MFVAIRDLAFARGRFALMASVVALIAMLGVVLTGLATGLADSGVSALRAMPATDIAFSRAATGELFSRSVVDRSQWEGWARQPGIRAATPFGNALVHGAVVSGPGRGTQIDLALFGVEPGSFMAPRPVSGRALGSSADGILVSKQAVKDGLAVGDVVTVAQSGVQMRVVGEVGDASYAHVDAAYTALPLWQRIHYGLPGAPPASAYDVATAVALQAAPGADLGGADRRLGTKTVTKAASFDAAPGYSAESGTMALIRGFLYVISALVVGAFFTVWTIQRRTEIAVLRAIGASRWYVLRDALSQVLVVLVLATAVGTAVGLLLGSFMTGSAVFSLQVGPVVTAGVLLVVVGLMGSTVAVRRITSVDPLVALGANR